MRVLICDREAILAEALGSLLARNGCETMTCVDPGMAAEMMVRHDMEVCVTELDFGPALSGIEVIRAVKTAKPQATIVVLSSRSDPDLVEAAEAAGAKSFLCKTHSTGIADEIFDSLLRIGFVVRRCRRPFESTERVPEGIRGLTRRELQVLEQLVNGHTAPVIARNLEVTYATARTYVQRVLDKLGVHTRLEAVALAASEGLLSKELRGGGSAPRAE